MPLTGSSQPSLLARIKRLALWRPYLSSSSASTVSRVRTSARPPFSSVEDEERPSHPRFGVAATIRETDAKPSRLRKPEQASASSSVFELWRCRAVRHGGSLRSFGIPNDECPMEIRSLRDWRSLPGQGIGGCAPVARLRGELGCSRHVDHPHDGDSRSGLSQRKALRRSDRVCNGRRARGASLK